MLSLMKYAYELALRMTSQTNVKSSRFMESFRSLAGRQVPVDGATTGLSWAQRLAMAAVLMNGDVAANE